MSSPVFSALDATYCIAEELGRETENLSSLKNATTIINSNLQRPYAIKRKLSTGLICHQFFLILTQLMKETGPTQEY